MAIDYDRLINWRFADVEHEFTKKDAILYALGVVLGHDPTDLQQLRFVGEHGLEPAGGREPGAGQELIPRRPIEP